jgi:hypothetical protein
VEDFDGYLLVGGEVEGLADGGEGALSDGLAKLEVAHYADFVFALNLFFFHVISLIVFDL